MKVKMTKTNKRKKQNLKRKTPKWIINCKKVSGDNKAFDIQFRDSNGKIRCSRILAMRVI